MVMNQDDILRELELLPVWQQRNPVTVSSMETMASQAIPVDKQAELKENIDEPSYTYRYILGQENDWLFLGDLNEDAEAEQLLNNMLHAVGVRVAKDTVTDKTDQIVAMQPKIIVVLGEGTAQQFLNLKQPMLTMRAKVHRVAEVPVVVTYSPAELLLNLSDKAKAWEDLCLAKFTIANL